MKTRIITLEKDFFTLKSAWEDLEKKIKATPFQSWAWCWHFWKTHQIGELAIITIFDKDDNLIGLAPLKTVSFLGIRRCSFIAEAISDYGDFLVDQRFQTEILKAFTEAILSLNWDVLDLCQVPESWPLAKPLENEFFTLFILQASVFVAALPSKVENLKKQMTKKLFDNVRYWLKRLKKTHSLELEIVKGEDVRAGMEDFFLLHQQRWLSKFMPGVLFFKKTKEFHCQTAESFDKDHKLMLAFLKIDGSRVASAYGFLFNETFYYYLGGFNPKWSYIGPGSLLLYFLSERLINEGYAFFDFLRGQESYKLRWGSREIKRYRLIISKNRFLVYLIKIFNCSSNFVKDFMNRR